MTKIKWLAALLTIISCLSLTTAPALAARYQTTARVPTRHKTARHKITLKPKILNPASTNFYGGNFDFSFHLNPALLAATIPTPQAAPLSPVTSSSTVPAPTAPATDLSSVAAQADPAVVFVNTYKSTPTYAWQYSVGADGQLVVKQVQTGTANQLSATGSGFFISSRGYILTNKHVVPDPQATYQVVVGGHEAPAQVVFRDPNTDLAVLKIDGANYPALALGDSSTLNTSQNVVALGNAWGQMRDVSSSGQVTALDQNILVNGENGTSESLSGIIAMTAKLYPGDSGGPLLNSSGQVVGLDTATNNLTNDGFAIPINDIKTALANAGLTL